MITQPRWIRLSVIFVLILLTFERANADGTSNSLLASHTDHNLVEFAGTTNEARGKRSISTSDEHDSAETIEEIIVIGHRKKGILKADRKIVTNAVIKHPSLFRWQLFPNYDPQQDIHNVSLARQDEIARLPGNVTIFRLRFGQ